jgi:hypothetical protein
MNYLIMFSECECFFKKIESSLVTKLKYASLLICLLQKMLQIFYFYKRNSSMTIDSNVLKSFKIRV